MDVALLAPLTNEGVDKRFPEWGNAAYVWCPCPPDQQAHGGGLYVPCQVVGEGEKDQLRVMLLDGAQACCPLEYCLAYRLVVELTVDC